MPKIEKAASVCITLSDREGVLMLIFLNKYGKECWCSNSSYGQYGKLKEKSCDMPCSGDDKKKCGAAFVNSVYSGDCFSRKNIIGLGLLGYITSLILHQLGYEMHVVTAIKRNHSSHFLLVRVHIWFYSSGLNSFSELSKLSVFRASNLALVWFLTYYRVNYSKKGVFLFL